MSAKLILEMGGDTSGLETSLNRADAMLDKFEHKVSSKFQKAFGIGFFASALIHIPMKIREMADAAEELSKSALKLGTTTDEYQMLEEAAKKAGQTVQEYVEINLKQGVMLDTLIHKSEKYREEIKMTQRQIQDLAELKAAGGALGKGAFGPLISGTMFLGSLGLDLVDLAGFLVSGTVKNLTMGKLNLAAGGPEDFLWSILHRNRFAGYEEADPGPSVGAPSKAQIAAHAHTQKAYDKMLEEKRILEYQKDALEQARKNQHHWSWISLGAAPLGMNVGLPGTMHMEGKADQITSQLDLVMLRLNDINVGIGKLQHP